MLKGAACAPSVRSCCVGASVAPAEKVAGRKRESREAGKKKKKKKRREEGRAGRENMIRVKEEKPGASARAIYARITRISRVGRERKREKRGGAHTFSSLRVEAPGRFSAARVSRGELVRSLQNTENTCLTLNYHASSFHPVEVVLFFRTDASGFLFSIIRLFNCPSFYTNKRLRECCILQQFQQYNHFRVYVYATVCNVCLARI